MTVLCAHSSFKYYALTLTFGFPLSVSVSPSVSPTISGYRMPHIALSVLVIDSHVRWQIDHHSSLGFSNCGSGPPPHHHYSLWPIDLPGWGASGLGVQTKDSFFFPYLILPLSVSVHATSLWPAVKTEDDYIKVFAPCIHAWCHEASCGR